jgi:DNA-binding transcriptional LysR family regulator
MERQFETGRLRLRHFNCLVAVSQERNLGKAAAKLRLSQPAVSKTLSELENILGVRLFERGRLGAQLTRDGEAFLVHAVSVLDSIGAARNAVGPDKTPSAESVFVGALPTVAPDLLPAALSAFRKTRPHTRVVIQTAANAPLLEMLKSGAIDFAVGRMADPRMMAGLAFELLFVEPLVLAVRAGHPLSGAGAVALSEVLEFPLIVTTKGTIPRHNTESYLQSRGFRLPQDCIETISVSVARLIAQQSDAVWFTPAGAVREDIDQGSLIALEVSMEGTEEPVGMLHRSEGVPRPPALEFMKILREAATARRLAARG